jgi:hypothetical protein
MKCPLCDEEKLKLTRIIYNNERVCRECFNSPVVRYCHHCMEYYPITEYLVTQNCCTGCYDAKAGLKRESAN